MPVLRIRSIDLDKQPKDPGRGNIGVRVALEQGRICRFSVATIGMPLEWVADADFAFSSPVLFVKDLRKSSIEEAIGAMAAEMSGYWLRYYNTQNGPDFAQGRGISKLPKSSRLATVDLVDLDAPVHAQTGVVEIRLKDSRLFSVLTATAFEFVETFQQMGLKFYFGSQVLFLREISHEAAFAAAEAMAKKGDRWLCIFDTPRTALPRILSEFKSKHA
ncbi:MAG: hypothetical protein HY078_06200 [Elusimicrobia bacterium]|nr:hypothetical protein [Elusimicrobiota bacterium]